MTTAFEVLYDLAIELRTNPELEYLTAHHEPNRDLVEQQLRTAILKWYRPEFEQPDCNTMWFILKTFCLNYVTRSNPPATINNVRNVISEIEEREADDKARCIRLSRAPSELAQLFHGDKEAHKYFQQFITAIELITSAQNFEQTGVSFLHWVTSRRQFWEYKTLEQINLDDLVTDLLTLKKISGVGIPVAANFFADICLPHFAKPDLHVEPIVNLLQIYPCDRYRHEAAVKGIVKIARKDWQVLQRNERFGWLFDCGGLWPRCVDRVLYLIGSDKLDILGNHNVACKKRESPKRHFLIRDQLRTYGLFDGTYALDG